MTKEQAVRILDPETREDALAEIEYYRGFRGEEAVKAAMNEACRIAAAELRKTEVIPGKPLTMEQLRGMDGQPVLIEHIGDDSPKNKEWALVFCKEKLCRTSCGNIAIFAFYGIGWLAYAYQPAHIDREAWRCPICSGNEVIEFKAWKTPEQIINGPFAQGGAMFCPRCGKPRTPEAWAELKKRLRG